MDEQEYSYQTAKRGLIREYERGNVSLNRLLDLIHESAVEELAKYSAYGTLLGLTIGLIIGYLLP